jgi:Domain of unknown function (DUF5753)/Helix-turn-helix domain
MNGRLGALEGGDPAVVRRRLARDLRGLRATATQRDVAEALDWSPSKLLRIENATIGISTTDLRVLLAHYGVDDQELVDRLVGQAQQSRRPAASRYSDVLEPDFVTYLRYESSASTIRQYHPYLVPGLLQTEEYARALILAFADRNDAGTLELEESKRTDRQIEARLRRQAILHGDSPPQAHFILDEAALRRRVDSGPDGTDVRKRQWAHLLTLDQNEHITVQVLPFDAGVRHGGQWPFLLLEFPAESDDPLLYLEGSTTAVTRDNPSAVAQYASDFIELEKAAVGGDDLARFVERCSG